MRNAVYEQVFDERWARTHFELNVNWRRRLARLAAMLLVLTVLLTIPLALYAWRQKADAEYQARQAQLERDEATRQRVIAENSLSERTAALETAEKLVAELRRIDPKSAVGIYPDIAREREEAQKAYLEVTTRLRAERDDALRRLDVANQRLKTAGVDLRGRATSPKAVDPKPAPAVPPPTADELAVRRVLSMYAAAYSSRNIEDLKRVQPLSSAQTDAIKSAFADALAYRLTIDKEDIGFSADGRKATVTSQVTRVLPEKRRAPKQRARHLHDGEAKRELDRSRGAVTGTGTWLPDPGWRSGNIHRLLGCRSHGNEDRRPRLRRSF